MDGSGQTCQKRTRRQRGEKPIILARHKLTLSEAISWCHAALETMPLALIFNCWKASGLLPSSFWEAEGSPRLEQLENAQKMVE